MAMQFAEALRYLLSLGHETLAIKLGLRNISLLLEQLGNPQQSYFSVQIAGTNGKGSTAAMLASISESGGIRAGLFTSPHLSSITERIKLNGQEISQDSFALCATRVRDAAEELLAQSRIEALPSFFEQVTAIALLAFQEHKVELAILETGLGGRLDATTAAGATLVAITPIAIDHEEYLGETISSIATEKAAIIRPGTSAIIAQQSSEALHVILERAASRDVHPSVNEIESKIERFTESGRARVTFRTSASTYSSVSLGLRGKHQVTNASVALRLAESLRDYGFAVSHEAIVNGLEKAEHPGRLELIDSCPRVLLDGAHNPSGARTLKEYLSEFVSGPVTLIFGAMKDKRLDEMAEMLFPLAQNIILTRPDNPRAASLEALRTIAAKVVPLKKPVTSDSVNQALRKAEDLTEPHGLICVAGSLYLIGEISRRDIPVSR